MSDDVKFFKKKADLREWFEENHDKLDEQWIGFWKKATERPSVTWHELVDVALCFGWIDGILKSIDAESHKQRVTPRRQHSIWSEINIKRVGELIECGEMTAAGLAAFARREESRSGIYTHENPPVELSPEFLAEFKRNKKAWDFFAEQPAGYQRQAKFWVMAAKRDATRLRRMETLTVESAAGRRLAQFRRWMDIRAALLAEHSKSQTMKIVEFIDSDPAKSKELMCYFLKPTYRLSQRAAAAVNYCVERNQELIKPYFGKLVERLEQGDVHVAVRRNVARMFQFVAIPKQYEGRVFDACYNLIDDPKQPVAVRAFSLTVAAKISRDMPDLLNELRLVAKKHPQAATAGFRSRCRSVLGI